MQHRKDIEGLRAIAVFPVVLFHAGISGFDAGFVGVDIFFVLSGFLLTSIIVEDHAAGRFLLRRFYERRARRLLPALFPVLLASCCLSWMVMTPPDFRLFAQSLGASAVFMANMLFARKTGYFDDDEGFGPLLHLWSLSVEEQFYIVFPLLVIGVLALWRGAGAHRRLLLVLAALAAASFTLGLVIAPRSPPLAFFSLPTRAWELLAGAVCALWPPAPARAARALAGAGLIAAGFVLAEPGASPGWILLLPVCGTALVLRHARKGNVIGKALARAPLPQIGTASYGIYLWHLPLLATLDYVWLGQPPLLLSAGVIALAILLGFASLVLIERPVRNGTVLRQPRTLALCCIALLLATLAIGVAGHLRWLQPRSIAASTALGSNAPPGEHETVFVPEDGQQVDFVVYGDSHARQYFPALQERLGAGAMLTVPGCLSVPGMTSREEQSGMATDCASLPERLAGLVTKRDIKTVVWAQRWDREMYEANTLRPIGQASGKGWLHLRAGIERLRATLPRETRLILVGNVPTSIAAGPAMDGGYLRCLAYRNLVCPASFPRTQAEGHRINPLLRTLAATLDRTDYFDPEQVLCDADGCALMRRGKAIYHDWTHLTAFGAQIVAGRLAPRIKAPFPQDSALP